MKNDEIFNIAIIQSKDKKLEIATVIAPYEATTKEQLSLALGQMVLVRKKTDTGWWQGELQAGVGLHECINVLQYTIFKMSESKV